jgi:hypothetical protein
VSKKQREREATAGIEVRGRESVSPDSPAGVLRTAVEAAGESSDGAAFVAAAIVRGSRAIINDVVAGLADGESSEVEVRATIPAHPTDQTEVKTMVERQDARVVQRVFRCVYDEQALARQVPVGARDPDVFCPVCGNRMVRER